MPRLDDRCGVGNSAFLLKFQSNSQKFLPRQAHRLATWGCGSREALRGKVHDLYDWSRARGRGPRAGGGAVGSGPAIGT